MPVLPAGRFWVTLPLPSLLPCFVAGFALPLPAATARASPPPACDTRAVGSGRAVSQHPWVPLPRGPPATTTPGGLPLRRDSGRTPSFTPWAQGTL